MASAGYGVVSVHQADSIEDRVHIIGQQVDNGQRDPQMRKLAYQLVYGAPEFGSIHEDMELSGIFYPIRHHVDYRQESRDYDYFASPLRTWEMKAGDCDCHTALVAALTSHLGFLSGAKIISGNGRDWHIYPVAGVRSKQNPSSIVPLDTTQKLESYPGWEPGWQHRQREILATFSGGKTYLREIR
jgi:hypothetical protein